MDSIKKYAKKFKGIWGSGRDVPFTAFTADSRKAIATLLALEGPLTAKQISEKLGLSATTVLDHIKKLVEHGIVKEVEYPYKKYKQERYYALAIPVFTVKELESLKELLKDFSDIAAEAVKKVYEKSLMKAEEWFKDTLMAKQGYKLTDNEIRWLLWMFVIMSIIEEKLREYGLIKSPFETEKGCFVYLVIDKGS
ncbi:MAG: hypothetical protein DRJ52_03805 [Thermoprotei archaeon]|nr:MAG: hypothetical protein DRJ52_03805 [Thermoprotei archaeon]RLE98482.1 MAG: hypothetical protein DRJ63_07605 [Thermoprotei archaeon]HDI75382.1 ArsR family transcriptional regulator [Thermoprotei archaeon]